MTKKKKSGINVAKSRQHHNVNGEEPDPQLDFLLSVHEKQQNEKWPPEDGSDSDDGTVDLIVGATKVDKDSIGEDQNLSVINEENVEIIDDEYGEWRYMSQLLYLK